MTLENQDQRPGESVGEMDQIAELLLGGLDEDSDIQDGGNDESQPEPSTEQEEVDADQVESSDDSDITWASALGLDDNDIVLDEEGNIKGIKVSDDEHVTLSELKNGYQFSKANTQRAQALAEERKQFDEVKNMVTTEYTKKLQNANKLTELLANKFLEDYNSIDWNRLRAEKPGEYAALQRDYDAKRSELQNIFAALEAEGNSLTAEQEQERSNAQMAYLNEQARKVIDNNPDWKDVAKFKVAMSDMVKFVGEAYGFTQEEFNSVYDARLIELIKDAMKFRNGTKLAQDKLVNKVPKFQKSTGQVKKTTKLDSLVKRAKNAKGYQKRSAETDAIAALLLQG